MAINLTDREGRPLKEGDLVSYHGSAFGEHGEWEVYGPCSGCPECSARWSLGEPARMRLIRLTGDGWGELDHVAPKSVTAAGYPLPERDGVTVLGEARQGDVIDVPWMWPHRIFVEGITPAGRALVRVEWTAPGDLSGVLESTGGALAALAGEERAG